MLMLGGQPDNRFSKYLKVAKLPEVANVSCGDEALKNVLDTYGYFIGKERKLMAAAAETDNEVTAAMMSNYLREQEKMVWMLVAYYNGTAKNKNNKTIQQHRNNILHWLYNLARRSERNPTFIYFYSIHTQSSSG